MPRVPPDDLLGGAVLGLVVGPVVFLFTHLAELAAGAIRTSAGTAWSHFWSLSARTVGNLLY